MYHENTVDNAFKADENLPALILDPDDYRQDLAVLNMTEQQENELLEVLWNIMKTLVEIGWGVNSVQYLLPDIFEAATADSVKSNVIENQDGSANDE